MLNSLDDRQNSLANDTTDWVIGAFSVTPARAGIVDFVRPYYYSSGAMLFAPGGKAPAGIDSWESISGKKIAALTGYYANHVLSNNFGADLVLAGNQAEAAQLVDSGAAVAYVDDSANLKPAGDLAQIPGIPVLLPTLYGVAVKKGNRALVERLSTALRQMATGGAQSDLARFEQQWFIANGAPPNADLAALLLNPDSTKVSLNAERIATAG
ncbi:ABC transporter substrate-binding [Chlorella sorokiniana]|uniref:ABC transporter substrate-binding n=1 Tax=Chlorella sorokiniana TaxID=3076 RepID=A0A2P6U464_CHLSO|nr:ABC transporter substrate-binding [Chlorella sorokiniana]|eukprot:PRW61110.1 ABC transporter substrate-binding [Chlorella sorokiniana]